MQACRPFFLVLMFLTVAIPGARAQTDAADRKAFANVKAQADKGSAEAQLDVARRYATGEGVSRDPVKANRWRRKAAEQGLATAQFGLALDYANGNGIEADEAEAFTWMQRAAAQNLAKAQWACGVWSAKGKGVKADSIQAVRYFREAAAQNLPEAIYELGNCYLEGSGVPKDISEGVKWIRRAAEQGFALAQNQLGLCYMKAQGVPKDNVQAYKWFNLAAAQGGEAVYDIRINLVKVEQLLTPEEIADAQQLSRDFKPGTPTTPDAANSTPPAIVGGPKTGVVQVIAPDDACEIFVDGAFVGNSPAKLTLPEGTHQIEVRKTGFEMYRREILVTRGAELNLHAVLEPQKPNN